MTWYLKSATFFMHENKQGFVLLCFQLILLYCLAHYLYLPYLCTRIWNKIHLRVFVALDMSGVLEVSLRRKESVNPRHNNIRVM